MKKDVLISAHGLVQCPTCQQHVKIAEQLEDTLCPFCELDTRSKRKKRVGRGLLAAALLGGTVALTGCPQETHAPPYGIAPQEEKTITQEPSSPDAGQTEQAAKDTTND